MDEHFKTLGLSGKESIKEIKKAYRILALKYHPDKNGGNKSMADKFNEVSKAYHAIVESKLREFASENASDLYAKRVPKKEKKSNVVYTYQNPYKPTLGTRYHFATEKIPAEAAKKSFWLTPITNKGCLVFVYLFWIMFFLFLLAMLI